MAEFCGFVDDRKVPDESHFSPLINGLRAGVTGDSATTRHRPAALCQKETGDD